MKLWKHKERGRDGDTGMEEADMLSAPSQLLFKYHCWMSYRIFASGEKTCHRHFLQLILGLSFPVSFLLPFIVTVVIHFS